VGINLSLVLLRKLGKEDDYVDHFMGIVSALVLAARKAVLFH